MVWSDLVYTKISLAAVRTNERGTSLGQGDKMIAITQVRDNKCLIQDSSGEAADNCTCLEAESTI